jgi:gamma-glutamyltranspeptidase / glutathione hydrolase
MRITTISLLLLALLSCTRRAAMPATLPYQHIKQAFGERGMVVTAHPLATAVGVQVLKDGGNAIDAAIAIQMMLAVVYPQAGNLGGGGFMVYRSADGKQVATLDYREKAPAAAKRDMYLDAAGNVIPDLSQKGRLAAGVPGSVAGMWASHQKYGKLPWAPLVAPALKVAKNGFQITKQEADNLNRERDNFLKYNYFRPEQLLKATPWQAGDLLLQKDLAATLQIIQEKGHDGFYKGLTAGRIATDALQGGGLITLADLSNYQAIWRTPLQWNYKDLRVISMPSPSSGGLLLQQMLTMLETRMLDSTAFLTTGSVHLMAEIERRAFADRTKHMADADFWKVPAQAMTQRSYLQQKMANFDPNRASDTTNVKAGVFEWSEQTTHLSVVDAAGNAVSVTTTLNDSYGSRSVVAGAGFILNNEMDDFSAKPGVPNFYGLVGSEANAIVPNKRMLSSMTPTIVLKDNQLWLVVGTPGGSTIPTSVFQVIVNLHTFKQPLKEAVHGLRFHHQYLPNQISYEKGAFSLSLVSELQAKGHTVIERGPIGRVEAIMVHPGGKLEGVADTRGDDCAGGF